MSDGMHPVLLTYSKTVQDLSQSMGAQNYETAMALAQKALQQIDLYCDQTNHKEDDIGKTLASRRGELVDLITNIAKFRKVAVPDCISKQQQQQQQHKKQISHKKEEEDEEDEDDGGQKQPKTTTTTTQQEQQMWSDTPKIQWTDVIGLNNEKMQLRHLLNVPNEFPQFCKENDNRVLLWGPPGTGKTLLAQASATALNGTFFHIKSSDFISKYVGDSEKVLRQIFKQAKSKQPSIIFIDELDGVATKRTDNDADHVRRLLTELLQLLNEVIDDKDSKQLYFFAAVNNIDDLDSALLRRFSNTLYIDLPSAEDRQRLIEYFLDGWPCDLTPRELKSMAKNMTDFSPNDIMNFVTQAKKMSIYPITTATHFRVVSSSSSSYPLPCEANETNAVPKTDIRDILKTIPKPSITRDHFLKAYNSVNKTMTADLKKKYEKLLSAHGLSKKPE